MRRGRLDQRRGGSSLTAPDKFLRVQVGHPPFWSARPPKLTAMRRSRSGQQDKVRKAREVVKAALGESARRDHPEQRTPNAVLPAYGKPIQPAKNESVLVLTMREAAVRLGISTGELEAMIARGRIKTLIAGWTTVIPTSEVHRLRADTASAL